VHKRAPIQPTNLLISSNLISSKLGSSRLIYYMVFCTIAFIFKLCQYDISLGHTFMAIPFRKPGIRWQLLQNTALLLLMIP